MTWQWLLSIELGKTLLKIVASLVALIVLITFVDKVESRNLLQQVQLIFYVWPVIVQLAVLLFAQKIHRHRWWLCLSSQGISSTMIYLLVGKSVTLYALVYVAFWWFGTPDQLSPMWKELSIHHCEFTPIQCSIPELWELQLYGEVVERGLRVCSFVVLPVIYFILFCTHQLTEWSIYALIIAGFLLQEIALAWFPL